MRTAHPLISAEKAKSGVKATRRMQAARLHLPPVDVVLVDDLQNVSGLEPQAGLLAGDQVVVGRVVVVVTLEEDLEARGRSVRGHKQQVFAGCVVRPSPVSVGWPHGSSAGFSAR